MNAFYNGLKVGILGGGQLGRMLIQAGIDFNINFSVLDPDPEAPCKQLADFHIGKLIDYDTVMAFGRDCDLLTIEIENVNVGALKELAQQGKKIFPQPEVIELIQDKRLQKQFYQQHNIPTAAFVMVENKQEVAAQAAFLPAVNKLGKEGYDGRGVQILRTPSDVHRAFDKPGLLEKVVDFETEIAVMVARNESGEVKTFPAVEMAFHPEANLVEFLFAPAGIDDAIAAEADRIARLVIEKLNMVGLLAVEMFVDRYGKILVNEVAPRPHNSGHHTIEANATSQYEQHLRAILNLPLGNTALLHASAMINLLGEEGYAGVARIEGLREALALEGVHLHLYGKKVTKPFRKMGHITVLAAHARELREKVTAVKKMVKIKA
jgi:5-(carboxyamino)imidazole ribonucleotide synthase